MVLNGYPPKFVIRALDTWDVENINTLFLNLQLITSKEGACHNLWLNALQDIKSFVSEKKKVVMMHCQTGTCTLNERVKKAGPVGDWTPSLSFADMNFATALHMITMVRRQIYISQDFTFSYGVSSDQLYMIYWKYLKMAYIFNIVQISAIDVLRLLENPLH